MLCKKTQNGCWKIWCQTLELITHKYDILKVLTSNSQSRISVSSSKKNRANFDSQKIWQALSKSVSLLLSFNPLPPTEKSGVKATLTESKPESYRHLRAWGWPASALHYVSWCLINMDAHGPSKFTTMFQAVSWICRCRMWRCIQGHGLMACV